MGESKQTHEWRLRLLVLGSLLPDVRRGHFKSLYAERGGEGKNTDGLSERTIGRMAGMDE